MVFLYNASTILPAAGQTVKFDYISIAYLVIVVLMLIIGIKKGFIAELLSLFGFVLALVGAIYLSKPFGNWLQNQFGWGDNMTNSVYSWILSKSPDASQTLNNSEAAQAMPPILAGLSIPSIFNTYITNYVLALVPADNASVAIGIYIAQAVTNVTFIAIAFLVLLILFSIVLFILKRLTKNINKAPVIGTLNRVLGAVIGLVIGCLIVTAVSYGATAFSSNQAFSDWLSATLYLKDDTVWTFGKMVYEQNFLAYLIGFFPK